MKKSGMILTAVCVMAMSHGANAAVMPPKAYGFPPSIVTARVLAPAVGEAKSLKISSADGVKIHGTGGNSLKQDEKSENDR